MIIIRKQKRSHYIFPVKETDVKSVSCPGDIILSDKDIETIIILSGKTIDGKTNPRNIDLEELKKRCALAFNVDVDKAFKTKYRGREHVYCRDAYIYILYLAHYGSLAQIGGTINKDHATVLHVKNVVDAMLFVKEVTFYPMFKGLCVSYGLWNLEKDQVKFDWQ